MEGRARTWWWIAFSLGGALLLAQFVRPVRSNPPEDPSWTLQSRLPPNSPVLAVVDRACADCHSNRTRWPWYGEIAPISWIVAHDVKEARAEMNLSEWGRLDEKRQEHLRTELCEDTREGEMPPLGYRMVHREARLVTRDVDTLCAWAVPRPENAVRAAAR